MLTKEEIQKEAFQTWKSKNNRGTIVLPTGVGKTKIAIDVMLENKNQKVLVVVPTVTLRDKNWLDEINKWTSEKLNVDLECYVYINKIEGRKYDLVILDECHHLTINNIEFFKKNTIKNIIGLSATIPDDKVELINKICPIIYKKTLQEVKGSVNEFNVKVINLFLNSKEKKIKSGNKKHTFYQTEVDYYNYWDEQVKYRFSLVDNNFQKALGDWVCRVAINKRKQFIYSCPTKMDYAKKIIKEYIDKKDRFLCFSKSIDTCENLMGKNVYHSKTDDNKLKDFIDGKIDNLGVVDALNEGINIPNLRKALIVQVDSKEKNMIQRIGRAIRLNKTGEPSEIIILCVKDTIDERWVESSIKNLGGKVQFYNYNEMFI